MKGWIVLASMAAAWGAPVEFNRDVRPILSDKCFLCHGPDAKNKGIPLRLDVEAEARQRAIVAGDPDRSPLIRRVTADKPGLRMPPVHSGLKLTDREISTLRSWIAEGAVWEKHWSFLPPKRHTPPAPGHPIDAFVKARLDREGLGFSPEASRETVLRRAALDLTGLPPTPAELDAFLADRSPNAYEKAVDRLLASPRYGERMAIRWLDAARYADTNGYQFDGERYMWRWRDWVIESFNRNQPWDRFVIEQIAGDMLPNASRDQILATGFNRNHRGNTEDGLVPEEYAVEYVVDRVETTSAVFLGMTFGCARCHNHKYDPLTQKEFYQVFAYFNNIPENGRAMKYGNSPPLIPAPTADQQQRYDALNAQLGEVEAFLTSQEPAIAKAQQKWERSLAAAPPVWWTQPLGLDSAFPLDNLADLKAPAGSPAFAPGKLGQAARFDGAAYLEAAGAADFDIEDRFTLSAWVYADETPDGPVVTRMSDGPQGKGFGLHLDKGKVHVHVTSSYVTDALRMESEESLAAGRWYHLAWTYTGSRMAEGVRVYVDGRPAAMKTLAETLYRPLGNAGRRFKEPVRIGGGWGEKRRFRGMIDDARIWSRVLDAEEVAALAAGDALHSLAAIPEARRTPAQARQLRASFLEHAAPGRIRDAWTRATALRREREALERSFSTVMVMQESPVQKATHLLIRGAYDKPGERVEPGLPDFLPPLPAGAPNNRLGFAQWLIDPGNPLLARVTVNRFWQMYFGTGLVKTVEDFGLQGEWPSHPELLDWLATEFIRTGWDVKALHKLIVTSATYRQSSAATPGLIQRDPENRLLARGPRFRLPAEVLRDQALAMAGLLTEKLGGRSVMPYQPDGLWGELIMQDQEYVQSQGPDLYRRSLYTFWKRTVAPPMMVNFDAANREACVVRENRTNTPLQALNLMNDVTFVEAGRFLGQRMMREGGRTAESRLRHGFRIATGRTPRAAELDVLTGSLRYHLDYFSGREAQAEKFLAQGDSPADPALPRRELAAYAAVASLLLNLDETVTKE
ncbi:MAG: DUF1553 domain-containing protein [Bryobacterales bacterium]|nr:DUF1553 domain-containing protein [Bryobacterales bacterium]